MSQLVLKTASIPYQKGIKSKLTHCCFTFKLFSQKPMKFEHFFKTFLFSAFSAAQMLNGRRAREPTLNPPQSPPSYFGQPPKYVWKVIRNLLAFLALILTQKSTTAYLHESKEFMLFAPFVTRCISANGVRRLSWDSQFTQPLVAAKFKN